MHLKTSYKQIFNLSLPIMLGSAAQNIIVLSDNVFLYHYDKLDFEAAGVVGVFYLIIASIGYGFSRGGQIIMARRNGEHNYIGAGLDFKALFIFEFLLSLILFFFLQYGSESVFHYFIKDPEILKKCIEYIEPRSYGVFFSYLGVALVSYYTAIARTNFIVIDTIVLIIVNLVLNYVFVFGKFGFAPMGIAGSALASTLAEVIAFIVFVVYIIFDKENKRYHLLSFKGFSMKSIANMFSVSIPIVFQSILGIGSWFLFFAFVENVGREELGITNLMRTIYLILSIPCWGYSAGINTMVSSFIGNRKRQAVMPLIIKTAKLNAFSTAIISIPVLMYPEFFLYPLFGDKDMSLILSTKPYMLTLFLVLMVFSIGGIFINGLIGTGHTRTALSIQTIFTIVYIIYSFLMIKVHYSGLDWAWAAEIVYWGGITIMTYLYLRSNKWHTLRF
jgi:putative MATE family efflux protein